MGLTKFDFAVFKYANQTGQDSEAIYKRIEELLSSKRMEYHMRCTENQLLNFLEEIVRQDHPSFVYPTQGD